MAQALAGGNNGVALLANTIATGAILFVLITMLGPISGTHFNPAVTLVAAMRRDLPWLDAAAYLAAQFALGIRSEEHTSELQSLMRISYAVFCLKKKKQTLTTHNDTNQTRNNKYNK